MIKDIIRLKWESELPHEQIAAALAVSKGVVTKYAGLATAAGPDWHTVREWERWYRRVFDHRLRTLNFGEFRRWLDDRDYEPVLEARHRHSAKWTWW